MPLRHEERTKERERKISTTITTNSIKPHTYICFALCACRAIQNGEIEKKEKNFHGLCHILLCFEGVLRSLENLRAFSFV